MTELSERLSNDRIHNVLVLAPPMSEREDDVCTELMGSVPPSEARVLAVTMTRSPDDLIETWLRHMGAELPAETVILSAETGRGPSGTEPGNPAAGHGATEPVRIATVSDPGDLTGLGVAITRHLDRWEDERESVDGGDGSGGGGGGGGGEGGGDGNGGATETSLLCFRSISTLLQYADLEDVFKFLHTLTYRVEIGDARGHYHMDPASHDEQTVQTLLQLFDAAVRVEDGTVDVRTRPRD